MKENGIEMVKREQNGIIVQVSDLEAVVGQSMTYAKLCDRLKLKKQHGNSKDYQLKQLSSYCNLESEKIGGNTYYTITEVYDERNFLDDLKEDTRYFYLSLALYSSLFPKAKELNMYDDEGYLTISASELMIELGYLNGSSFFEDVRNNKDKGNYDYYSFCEQAYKYCKDMMHKDLGRAEKNYAVIREKGFILYKRISYYDETNKRTLSRCTDKMYVPVHSKLWNDIFEIYRDTMPKHKRKKYYVNGNEDFRREINKRVFELTEGKYNECHEADAIKPVGTNYDKAVKVYIDAMERCGLSKEPQYQIILKAVSALRKANTKEFREFEFNDIYKLYFADDYLLTDSMEKFTADKESRVYPVNE